VITTPLDTHEPLVREAITLRLPVVSDKPFTQSLRNVGCGNDGWPGSAANSAPFTRMII
jgi:hypothetical protein